MERFVIASKIVESIIGMFGKSIINWELKWIEKSLYYLKVIVNELYVAELLKNDRIDCFVSKIVEVPLRVKVVTLISYSI